MAADIADSRLVVIEDLRTHVAAGEAGRSLGRAQEMVDAMTIAYATEDYLGADEYIDVVKKSGLNRPVEDRGRVERYLKHSQPVRDGARGRQAGRLRPLADRFLLLLLPVATSRSTSACQGKGIGKRLIEETRKAAGGPATTTLLLSAPTAMTFYQGIKMPHAENCFLYRREI